MAVFSQILLNEGLWVAVGSLTAIVSVVLSAVSIVCSNKTRKRQATYDAFSELKKDVFYLEEEIKAYDIDEILAIHKQNKSSKEWINIKEYLSKIGRFATCVNNKVFDSETVCRMGGPYLVEMYKKLKPIIEYKRQENQRETVYSEFEIMVNELKELGKKYQK